MKKGMTLSSLVIYIIGTIAVLMIIATFNANTLRPANDYVRIAKMNQEYSQFNMYFVSKINDDNCNYATFQNSNRNIVLKHRTKHIDEETGEEYYTSTELGTFEYDNANKKIVFDDGVNEVDVCKFVNQIAYSQNIVTMDDLSERIKINVNIIFKIGNTTFTPALNINYVLGRM